MRDLMSKNFYDERLNVRQPMAMNRVIWSLNDIEYKPSTSLPNSLMGLFEQLAQDTSNAFPPYLVPSVLQEEDRA